MSREPLTLNRKFQQGGVVVVYQLWVFEGYVVGVAYEYGGHAGTSAEKHV